MFVELLQHDSRTVSTPV